MVFSPSFMLSDVLDNGCFESKLRGPDGGDVSAGTSADDDDIKLIFGHQELFPIYSSRLMAISSVFPSL